MCFFESPCLRAGILRARSSRYKTKSRPSGKLQCADLPVLGIKQAQLVLRKFDPRCDHPRNKESRESLGIEVVGNLGRVIFLKMQILYITCHLSKILSEPGSAGFKNILQRYQPKKGQHFKELGPLVLHYSACSGCDLYIRTFRDMSPRNILHREADMLRPVSRRVSATQMMTFWYFLAMTKHNLSIFVNKDCQSKSFFLGAGQANSLLSLTVADVFSWVLRHQLQRCFACAKCRVLSRRTQSLPTTRPGCGAKKLVLEYRADIPTNLCNLVS